MNQREWVMNELEFNGEVSRNTALKNYISRLSAIINCLKKEGYKFETEHRKGDFVYIREGQLALFKT